jgi:hypothetical protein
MHGVDLIISEYNFIHIYGYAHLLQPRGSRNIIFNGAVLIKTKNASKVDK